MLFRPVTVMVPDFQLIMENMMMAEGYTEAAELAKKFFTLYNLAGDLLGGNPKPTGKQLHYDWGLRAINSVPNPHPHPHPHFSPSPSPSP